MPCVPAAPHEYGRVLEELTRAATVMSITRLTVNTPDCDLCRHINQLQLTADGNFQLNKLTKNTDPDDVSIYDGRAYFPNDAEYQAYLKKFPKNVKEVFQCPV